tara:strand:+ start:57 stop:626 length:570 start_codon:yes stop_codon:yes gene_type:complete
MEDFEIGILVVVIMGGVFLFLNKNKAQTIETEDEDDLSSSLDASLNDLGISEREAEKEVKTSKIEAKKRNAFIQKKYKIIASFYNNYKFIDYGKKPNRQIAKKQMADIVNSLDPNLNEMEEFFAQDTRSVDYKIILVGIITFKHMKKETLNKVHVDLAKLYEMGQLLDFDSRLMGALERILYPFGYIKD